MVTRAGVTVDAQTVAGLDPARGVAGTDDRGQPVLARDDRGVRHDPADVRDRRGDRAEHRRPARGGHGGDEDLPGLKLAEPRGVEDHPRRPFDRPGRRTAEAPVIVVRPSSPGPRAAQAFVHALGRDPPQHDRHRLGDRLGDGAERRWWREPPHRLHDPLAPLHDRRPVAGAAAFRARRPGEPEIDQRVRDLVPLEVEDVLGVVDEPVASQKRAELAHLVPEDRVVPVLDVEVVALHVREYEPSQAEVLIERSDRVVPVEQRPVLGADPVALGAHLRQRAAEILAGRESREL